MIYAHIHTDRKSSLPSRNLSRSLVRFIHLSCLSLEARDDGIRRDTRGVSSL